MPARLVAGLGDLVAAPLLLCGLEDVPDVRGRVLLPGVGHVVPEEAPQAVVDALDGLPLP